MAPWTLAISGGTIGVWFDEAIPLRRSEKLMKRTLGRKPSRPHATNRTRTSTDRRRSKVLRKSNAPASEPKGTARRIALADVGRDNNAIGSPPPIQLEVLMSGINRRIGTGLTVSLSLAVITSTPPRDRRAR